MSFSLRHLSRSRGLNMLSLMAWLLFATTSVIASPVSWGGGEHGVSVAMANHSNQCRPDSMTAKASSCCHDHDHDDGHCQGHAGMACHCSLLCGMALTLAAAYAIPPWRMTQVFGDAETIRAPTQTLHPPLRPPAA